MSDKEERAYDQDEWEPYQTNGWKLRDWKGLILLGEPENVRMHKYSKGVWQVKFELEGKQYKVVVDARFLGDDDEEREFRDFKWDGGWEEWLGSAGYFFEKTGKDDEDD